MPDATDRAHQAAQSAPASRFHPSRQAALPHWKRRRHGDGPCAFLPLPPEGRSFGELHGYGQSVPFLPSVRRLNAPCQRQRYSPGNRRPNCGRSPARYAGIQRRRPVPGTGLPPSAGWDLRSRRHRLTRWGSRLEEAEAAGRECGDWRAARRSRLRKILLWRVRPRQNFQQLSRSSFRSPSLRHRPPCRAAPGRARRP